MSVGGGSRPAAAGAHCAEFGFEEEHRLEHTAIHEGYVDLIERDVLGRLQVVGPHPWLCMKRSGVGPPNPIPPQASSFHPPGTLLLPGDFHLFSGDG